MRWRHRLKRLQRAILAVIAIFVTALIAAHFTDGLDSGGILLTFGAMTAAFCLLAIYPRTRSLTAGRVRERDLPSLIERTQIWLEEKRGLLPAKTRSVADLISSQVAELLPHLETLRENDPLARELHALLGEHLPSLVESYVSIPAALTHQPHAGSTPAAQLHDGLLTVARELETVAKTVANGEMDALAIRGRYLETRYEKSSGDQTV